MKKRLLIVLGCVLLFVSGCTKEKETSVPELLSPVGVTEDIATVNRGTLKNVSYFEGSILPQTEALYFSNGGTIEGIYFMSGETVEEGEALFSINTAKLKEKEKQLKKKEENLLKENDFSEEFAKLDLQYLSIELAELTEKGASENEIALKQIEIERKELELEETRKEQKKELEDLKEEQEKLTETIQNSTLYAPISGTLFYGEEILNGANVYKGKTFAYIINEEKMLFETDEFVSDVRLQTGQYYLLIQGKSYSCEVLAVEEKETLEAWLSGEVKRKFAIKENETMPDLSQSTYGILMIEETNAEDVLLIPINGMKTDDEGCYVYMVSENGNKEKRYFAQGRSNEAYVEVKDGLAEGERIYVFQN